MNVLFVPTLGLDLSLLERLASSVDYPIARKMAFNNGEPGALDSFRDAHPDWIVKESAFGNMGVAGSWNQCAKLFPEEQSWLIMNDDAWFLPGYLETICKCSNEHETEPLIHLNSSNAYYCFVWTKTGRREFGEAVAVHVEDFAIAEDVGIFVLHPVPRLIFAGLVERAGAARFIADGEFYELKHGYNSI